LLWYPLTIHTLGWAFPGTTISQGIDLATQQITSIGYGSASVRGNDQKLFHAVNGLASQLGPAKIPSFLLNQYLDWILALMPAQRAQAEKEARERVKGGIKLDGLAELIKRKCYELRDELQKESGSTSLFASLRSGGDFNVETCEHADANELKVEEREKGILIRLLTKDNEGFWKKIILGAILMVMASLTYAILQNGGETASGLQALYGTLISATTIGYGDISPSTDWGKQLSAFVLPFLTAAFAQFFGGEPGGPEKEDIFTKWHQAGFPEDCGLPLQDLAQRFVNRTRLLVDATTETKAETKAEKGWTSFQWKAKRNLQELTHAAIKSGTTGDVKEMQDAQDELLNRIGNSKALMGKVRAEAEKQVETLTAWKKNSDDAEKQHQAVKEAWKLVGVHQEAWEKLPSGDEKKKWREKASILRATWEKEHQKLRELEKLVGEKDSKIRGKEYAEMWLKKLPPK